MVPVEIEANCLVWQKLKRQLTVLINTGIYKIMGSACNLIWYCMSYKMAAYSLAYRLYNFPLFCGRPAADCSCGVLVCGKSGAKFSPCRRSAADCSLWHTSMRQVWSKVSSCRRSAADCSCGILVCGKSAAKFHPAADLPQTVPVAY